MYANQTNFFSGFRIVEWSTRKSSTAAAMNRRRRSVSRRTAAASRLDWILHHHFHLLNLFPAASHVTATAAKWPVKSRRSRRKRALICSSERICLQLLLHTCHTQFAAATTVVGFLWPEVRGQDNYNGNNGNNMSTAGQYIGPASRPVRPALANCGQAGKWFIS